MKKNKTAKTAKKKRNNETPVEMTVVGHLEELRRRLIYIIIAVVLGSIISFIFIKKIIFFLREPISGLNLKLYYFKPYEKLTTYFKIALFSSLVGLMPFVVYQISAFIIPALYKKERRIFYISIFFIVILFCTGAYFCYKIIAPISFKFFVDFMSGDGVIPLWGIKDYFSLLSLLVFFTGIIFQLPLIMMLLARIGIVSGKMLAKFRKHALLLIFIVAAIVTPPDVISQLFLGIPTYLLYELSIHLARIAGKRRKKSLERREKEFEDKNYTDNRWHNVFIWQMFIT